MRLLQLTAATSLKHRGPQCLLILTRSTSPPPPPTRSVPSACVLVSPPSAKILLIVVKTQYSGGGVDRAELHRAGVDSVGSRGRNLNPGTVGVYVINRSRNGLNTT